MLSYGKYLTDSVGCTHSIDNLVVEYLVKNFNAKTVLHSLATEVFSPSICGWEESKCSKTDMPACSAYSWFRSSIWGAGLYIQFGQYKDFDKLTREWSEYPLLRIKVNPNKHLESPLFSRLLDWLARECDNGVLVKFDYAVDVPCRVSDIQVHSRKEPGLLKGTRYYGQRNKHGRLKIYNKRVESDLDYDLSRVEWTFCYGKPLSFDDVYWFTRGPIPLPDVGDLSSRTYALARLLLRIRALGGDVADALGDLDPRTAKKLEPYTLGEGVQLISDYSRLTSIVEFYCDALSVAFSCSGVNGFTIGYPFVRLSDDDLEGDELPF